MNIRELVPLCIASFLLGTCSGESQETPPIRSDEYNVMSMFIQHVIRKEGKNSRFSSMTILIDTTSGQETKESFQFSDDAVFGPGGLARYLLSETSETFELGAIKRDYSDRMKGSYTFHPDSIRIRLLQATPSIADTIYAMYDHPLPAGDDNNSKLVRGQLYHLRLSRAGFNPTLDQAIAVLFCSNARGGGRYEACLKKENHKWRVVTSWTVRHR